MPKNTPNLNLYKKDPQTDGDDTFNIETMLNENFDKIDAAAGDQTISDGQAPSSSTGTTKTLLGWLANMIKSITGKSSWRTAPATTLEKAKEHADDTTRHISSAERTAWNNKETTAGAQAKADAVQTNLTTHAGNTTAHITAAERTAWNAKANKAIPLPSSADLNTYLNEGSWVATTNAVAATITNRPSFGDYAFNLTVKTTVGTEGSGSGCNQTITFYRTDLEPPKMFTRNCYLNVWSPWVAIETAVGSQSKADAAQAAAIAYTDTKVGRVDLTQTLGPGTSVIQADQNGSELDLVVQGRTLVNLLGAYGDGESLTGWSRAGSALPTISTTQKRSGNSSFKMASGDTGGSYLMIDTNVSLETTKQYIVGCWVYIESRTGGVPSIYMYDKDTSTQRYAVVSSTTTVGAWQFIYIKVPQNNTIVGSGFRMVIGYGNAGASVMYYDELRVYEVSVAEYAAIGTTITGDAIDLYFPHVSGKQHVQGVAVTKQGRNLLPAIPEATASTTVVSGPYAATLTATANYQGVRIATIDALPNTAYTLSFNVTNPGNPMYSYLNIYSIDANGTATYIAELGATAAATFQLSKTVTTPSTCISLRVTLSNTGAGTAVFKNWQLELGSAATPFTPAEPQSVILPVTLGQIGDVRDSVYSAGTEWMYVEKIKKNVVLDGSMPWTYGEKYAGFHRASILTFAAAINQKGLYTKYDGSTSTFAETSGNADCANIYPSGALYISLPHSRTGWNDNVNPSNNAIKALFNGWKASANDGSAYTSWVSILDGSAPATNTSIYVSANKAPGWTAWATLDYVLASAVAPVPVLNSEGSITLHPGGNQISIETGIIQREKVNPAYFSTASQYYINDANVQSGLSKLSRRVAKILLVYKGADVDKNWNIEMGSGAYGNYEAYISTANYDSKADYYVTYIAMDKYAFTANVTETAATWRTGLGGVVSELVQSTAELRQDNDRQDFAIDYAEAKVDNLRLGVADASALPDSIQKFKLTEKTGYNKALPSSDFNNIKDPGEYSLIGSSMQNGPVPTPSGYLRVRAIDGGNVIQEVVLTPTFIGWSRRITGGTWNTWTENENAGKKNVAGGYAGLDGAANVSVDNLPFGSVTNILGDSGRFVGPDINPALIACSNTFANNPLFTLWNNTTVAGAGKFYHDNSTNGGAGGALTTDVSSLLSAMLGTSAIRYGTEFHIASYTMGNGTATPNATVPTTYLMTINNSLPAGGVSNSFTMSFWIRVKSGIRAVINKSGRLKRNGAVQSTHLQITPADGWMHIETVLITNNGYDNAAPNIHATPGDVVQIALPVVVAGNIGVGIHTRPVMGANLGFVPLPANSYTANDVLSKLITVDGAGSGLDADLHAGKTLADVVQGSLSYLGTLAGNSPNFTGSANPPLTALVAGQRLSFKSPSSTVGPINLNADGRGAKSIKKPNGNNPTLAQGGVYTVIFDGTAFILQGEGGEYGSAVAAEVLAGRTIGTESGIVTGAMPDNRGVARDAAGTTLDNAGNLFLNTPEGYYNPTSSIHSYEGNLADPRNWRQDRTMFGRLGTMPVINDAADPAQGVGLWGDDGIAVYPREGYRTGGAGAGEIKVSAAQAQSLGVYKMRKVEIPYTGERTLNNGETYVLASVPIIRNCLIYTCFDKNLSSRSIFLSGPSNAGWGYGVRLANNFGQTMVLFNGPGSAYSFKVDWELGFYEISGRNAVGTVDQNFNRSGTVRLEVYVNSNEANGTLFFGGGMLTSI